MENQYLIEKGDSREDLRLLIQSLKSWLYFLLAKWKVIMLIGLLGGLLGVLFAFSKTLNYIAKVDFVVEEGSRSGAGGLGGLAALAGVNLGGGGGGAFQGDNILELYKSRTIITEALLSKDGEGLLIDKFMSILEIRKGWKGKGELLDLDFSKEVRTYQQDSILGVFVKIIKEKHLKVNKPDKMLALVRVEFVSPDEVFSKDFAEALVAKVNEFYVETRTKKGQDNVAILQRQTDSVRLELDKSLLAAAKARELAPNANLSRSMSLNVPYAKHEVDVQINEVLIKELMKNLELTKLELRKETPLIQIIDRPILPLEVVHTSKLKSLIIGGILGGLLIVGYLVVVEYYRRLMSEEDAN